MIQNQPLLFRMIVSESDLMQPDNDKGPIQSFFSPGKSVRTNGAFTKFDPLNTIDSSLSQSTLINCNNSHVQFEGCLLSKTMFFQT